MDSPNPVSAEEHSTAQSLLLALDLAAWAEEGAWAVPWVFRGQRDASWGLAPSAWRTQATPPMQHLARLRDTFTLAYRDRIEEHLGRRSSQQIADLSFVTRAYAQARAEFSLLLDFVKLADELGHRVPALESYLRLEGHDYLPGVANFPLLQLLPDLNAAAALAQHHGVPTRSLDWTRNPLYAAYFAASDVEAISSMGSIAIWALRADLLLDEGRAESYNAGYTRFQCHILPNSENPYLRSQAGVFMHPTYGCSHIAKTGEFPCLEAFATRVQDGCSSKVIRKLTLPWSEMGELLRLLWLRGVSRAHLMPTIDNVTSALNSRWKWAS